MKVGFRVQRLGFIRVRSGNLAGLKNLRSNFEVLSPQRALCFFGYYYYAPYLIPKFSTLNPTSFSLAPLGCCERTEVKLP